MADEKYTFEQARIRLEEIAAEVRKKDTSLEKSLDLLEEGVRLANICTELVDHTDVSASITVEVAGDAEGENAEDQSDVADDAAPEMDGFEDVEEPSVPDADEGAEA
jgi:exodeoxyribonuclease VII small subunit